MHFDDRDVVRHKLVQQIVKAYEAFSSGNGGGPQRPRASIVTGAWRPTSCSDPCIALDTARSSVCASRWRGRPPVGLGSWLARVAPARARGIVSIAVVSDARVGPSTGLSAATTRRPMSCRFRVENGPARRPDRPVLSGRHRHRPRRRAPAGAGGRALGARLSSGCWRCTGCCTCSATITSAMKGRWHGWNGV